MSYSSSTVSPHSSIRSIRNPQIISGERRGGGAFDQKLISVNIIYKGNSFST
jgi:hypothetical protein